MASTALPQSVPPIEGFVVPKVATERFCAKRRQVFEAGVYTTRIPK
ncbi:MAG: hypothetical protein IPI41_07390 [Flavobacteriales bacterium]|nr:hypothetical protein [Flavobacteriales bacterium]